MNIQEESGNIKKNWKSEKNLQISQTNLEIQKKIWKFKNNREI